MNTVIYTKYLNLVEKTALFYEISFNKAARGIPNPIIGILTYMLSSLEGLWYANGISIEFFDREFYILRYRDLDAKEQMQPHIIECLNEWDDIVAKYSAFWPCKTTNVAKDESEVHEKVKKVLKALNDKRREVKACHTPKSQEKQNNKAPIRFDNETLEYPDNVLKQIVPEEYPFNDDLRKHFEECIFDLTDRQREVLYLRAKDKLSLKKIAEQLGLTPERVRQVQNKTLRILKRDLESIVDGTSIDSLKLSTRTYNAVKRALWWEDSNTTCSINEIEEYFKKHSLNDVRNMGKKSYAELCEKFFEKTGRELPEKETNDE